MNPIVVVICGPKQQNNNCLTKSVVYIAHVKDDTGVIRNYIGMTSNTFRKRYFTTTRTHLKIRAMLNPLSCQSTFGTWRTRTINSKSKSSGPFPKHASSYRDGARSCNLCLQEKLEILKGDKKRLLNGKYELFSKCCQRKKFSSGKFERACARNAIPQVA